MSETSVHELYKTGRTTLRVDIKAGSGLRPSTTSYSRTSEAIVYGRHTGFTFGVSSSPLNIALKPESVHRSLYGEHVTTRTLLKRAWPMSTHLPLIQLADAFDQNSQAPGWS
ncbi:hypothetical protein SARC_06321 [Sphaeroforma arctica JP610]|uniref:Uncharacterized protein n=1 Tax=Sphaeroforma arctica JP610 TaxID=667725 RepID=A0A0L0FWY7_9EUKA|nr:hypothetical protein SARC_06321 [Sphaeroforma arctica JP610]KNC81347.1 hypothetical protein SARC_06321 [Sphaeroforma arctica JP610]|eukprot:XP_014155249.1 hypothetical protein SARC_06321 [Sphaeroforma arctica JP610]